MPAMTDWETRAEAIKRLRTNLLVHSQLYYWMDDPVISDALFDRISMDLVTLQAEHGTEIGFYDEAFRDWTGATGCHLPQDAWVIRTATYVWRLVNDRGGV